MKHVSILVTHQSLIAAIGNTQYMFSMVNQYLRESGQNERFNVQLVGLDRQMNLGNDRYVVQPDTTIQEFTSTDLIIIPPMSGAMAGCVYQNKAYIPWIIKQFTRGAEVASLCVGAFVLAETGILDGKYCSTHWQTVNEFKMRYPKVKLVDHKILTDDRVPTQVAAPIHTGIF